MLETLNSIKNSLNSIVNGLYYVFHPAKGCKIIFIKFADSSYNIALIIGFCGIFLYICGSKKGRKLIPISLVGYTLIKSISSVLKSTL